MEDKLLELLIKIVNEYCDDKNVSKEISNKTIDQRFRMVASLNYRNDKGLGYSFKEVYDIKKFISSSDVDILLKRCVFDVLSISYVRGQIENGKLNSDFVIPVSTVNMNLIARVVGVQSRDTDYGDCVKTMYNVVCRPAPVVIKEEEVEETEEDDYEYAGEGYEDGEGGTGGYESGYDDDDIEFPDEDEESAETEFDEGMSRR